MFATGFMCVEFNPSLQLLNLALLLLYLTIEVLYKNPILNALI